MTLKTVWDIIHAILKKESKGNVITPDRFTDLLQQCHLEYYNQQYEKWAGSQRILDSLRPFVVLDEAFTVGASGTAFNTLAKPYRHLIGARTSSNVHVDIVTPLEWNEWSGDSVMKATTSYPLLTIDSSKLYVDPTSVGTDMKISYLAQCEEDTADTAPDTGEFFLPFFDYYIDDNYVVQYLENNESHALTTGEEYRDGSTSTTVTGISHELFWEDNDIINIISMLLQKIGISMQDANVAQYAMALQDKQDVQ